MINTVRLRCTIGWLGMLLPWIVCILAITYHHLLSPPSSISATYYYEACITPFMVVLGSASLLLFSYKGYETIDDVICSITGLCGLLVCLFPCNHITGDLVGTFQIPENISNILHSIAAIGFFGLLSYNSLFLFTKSSGEKTFRKKIRNIIYIVCGIGMILSIIGLAAIIVFNLPIAGGVWWAEMILLTFFGISWLTKADCYPWLFCDKK